MASSYNSSQAFKVARHFQFKNGVNVEAITANKTLTYSDGMFQVLNPDAAHDLILPFEKDGSAFFVKNESGSFSLTVKDDGASTIATIAAGEGCILVCDGTAWKLLIKA
jgi:hypothetical protein